MSELDTMKQTVVDAITGVLHGVWNQDTDPARIDQWAQDIAEQKILAAAALTPEQADVHNRNVAHLLATVESIATARYIKAYSVGLDAFIGAVKAVISLIVTTALTQ